jgi:phosphatidylserine decarboxylase
MRIHPEGYPTLGIVTGGVLLINALLALVASPLLPFTALLGILVVGFFLQFFRHPHRTPPHIPHAILSPADGTVVAIERVYENEYFQSERLKISIFMAVVSVHCNRIPISGQVVYRRYHAGKYLMAFHPKSSELNERATVVLQDEHGRAVLVRQIAGILARRIVTYPQAGESVTVGAELGFIKFGSRCDVFLPLDAEISVQLQQRVQGGTSVLAHFRAEAG